MWHGRMTNLALEALTLNPICRMTRNTSRITPLHNLYNAVCKQPTIWDDAQGKVRDGQL